MPDLETTFKFLKKLKKNNTREWFSTNKPEYELALSGVVVFAEELLAEMQKHDQIETVSGKKSLYRIYRDIRFSKDKTPYKIHWAGGFKRATASLRGGYYFHLEPGNSLIAGGFWGPNSADLKHIRDHIAQDDEPLREVINHKSFKKHFSQLHGETLKTAPKGFDKEHPAVDLLRYKQFILTHKFEDDDVLSKDFAKKVSKTFVHMRPFLDCMSDILTTDLNGVPLI